MKKYTVILFLICTMQALGGTNRYVKQGNSISNDGLSVATAVGITNTGSLPAAFLATVMPGDTILYIGTFTNASYTTTTPVGVPLDHPRFWHGENTLRFNNLNGTAGNYITIKPYNSATLLKGDGGNIIRVQNSSYLRIEGFNIEGEVNNLPLSVANALQFVYILNTAVNVADPTPGELRYRDQDCVSNCTAGAVVEGETYSVLNPNNVFRPTYYDTRGIYLSDVRNIEILNNHIHHMPGGGLRVSDCEDILIQGNEINDCSRRSSGGTHGLVVTKATSTRLTDDYRVRIIANKVHHNYNEQYSWAPDKTIITPHIDEGKGISLQRNQTVPGVNWNNGRILIANNICYYNGYSGIHSNDGFRIDVINNTCYFNSYTGSVTYGTPSVNGGNIGISLQGGTGHKIINNISVIDGLQTRSAISTDIVATSAQPEILFVKDNIIYSTTGTAGTNPNIDAVQINTQNVNPQFVDAAAFNFSLSSTSPAINKADTTHAPKTDYYGFTRTVADIGAVEYFAVLPVTLTDFKLSSIANNKVKLVWKTLAEYNSKYFIVEKSKDGVSWTDLAKITAAGFSNSSKDYTAIDSTPYKGKNFYRLKQVDNDGKFTYSKILETDVAYGALNIYPNPAGNILMASGLGDNGTLSLLTMDGRKIDTLKTKGNTVTYNLQNLKAGSYILQYIDNESAQPNNVVAKVIKVLPH
jgi:parallel beta-helix repeat protein